MALDPHLLADARAAQVRLIEAEHAGDVARADFHRAVRRLQLAGASMRETAAALGLSHQRVHQIVEAAGGSRRWGKRREHRDVALRCTFCGRAQDAVTKLVAGPGVCICDGCVSAAAAVIATGGASGTSTATIQTVPAATKGRRCSFCTRRRHQVTAMAVVPGTAGDPGTRKVAGDAAVCGECLQLCGEILATS